MISIVVTAKALYSASVLDRETVDCFRALQEIRLGPRKIQKPPVDFQSSWQLAQSASEYAWRERRATTKKKTMVNGVL